MLKYPFRISSIRSMPRGLFSLDLGFKVLAFSKLGPCVFTHTFKIWTYDCLCKCDSVYLSYSDSGISALAELPAFAREG